MKQNPIPWKIRLLIPSLLLSAAFAFPAMATETQEISQISLSIDTDNIEVGSTDKTVAVYVEGDGYYAANNEVGVAVNMNSNRWVNGMIPKFRITLKADEGYRFNSSSLKKSGYYNISGSNISFDSASGNQRSITLTVKMPKLKGDAASMNPTNLYWNGENKVLYWDPAEGAEKYQLRLYRGSSQIASVDSATGTSYSFARYITEVGKYTVKMRGFGYGSYGSWISSGELNVTRDGDVRPSPKGNEPNPGGSGKSGGPGENMKPGSSPLTEPQWILDQNGWWYLYADRTYPKSQWSEIKGAWYHFNEYGYMQTGWLYLDNKWYYLHPTIGNLLTGWILYKDNWYYLSPKDGVLYQNTTTPDGYRVDHNGAWIP